MTATLSMPKSAALGMLAKAQTGDDLIQILNAVVDTQEDQVPTVDVEIPAVEDVVDDAYILENDYDDSIDV